MRAIRIVSLVLLASASLPVGGQKPVSDSPDVSPQNLAARWVVDWDATELQIRARVVKDARAQLEAQGADEASIRTVLVGPKVDEMVAHLHDAAKEQLADVTMDLFADGRVFSSVEGEGTWAIHPSGGMILTFAEGIDHWWFDGTYLRYPIDAEVMEFDLMFRKDGDPRVPEPGGANP